MVYLPIITPGITHGAVTERCGTGKVILIAVFVFVVFGHLTSSSSSVVLGRNVGSGGYKFPPSKFIQHELLNFVWFKIEVF